MDYAHFQNLVFLQRRWCPICILLRQNEEFAFRLNRIHIVTNLRCKNPRFWKTHISKTLYLYSADGARFAFCQNRMKKMHFASTECKLCQICVVKVEGFGNCIFLKPCVFTAQIGLDTHSVSTECKC